MTKAEGPGQSALLLLDVIDALDKLRIRYAVIGAFAASFYGVVRASVDADALISLPLGRGNLRVLSDTLHARRLKTTYRKGDRFDPVGAVLHVHDRFDNRVDLLSHIRGVTDAVFARTVEADFMHARIRVIGVEDFIAMKLFAGSPKDLSDVAGVLKVSHGRIHRSLLESLVQPYGTHALHKLQALLADTTP